MTPSEKERWRWEFAGRAFAAYYANPTSEGQLNLKTMLPEIDALIAALEASTVKGECDHEWRNDHKGPLCVHCGDAK